MPNTLNILIIDDDEDDFFITSNYLSEIKTLSIKSTWCYNIKDAIEQLKSNAFDIYFLDYRLGAKTGLELLKEAIQSGTHQPIILLTGRGTPEVDNRAVENGAYDYLIKSEINSEKLERCLRYALERYKSFKLIKDNEKKYRHIFENALSFIFTCNETMQFVDCNPASEYLLGFNFKELKGQSLISFIDKSDRQDFIKSLQARKNIQNYALKLIAKNDEIKTCNVSLSYFEEKGMENYWQGIIYDETLRMQAEQTKMQSEKIEATYRLVRTLAHEIRNPLTNIGLSLDEINKNGMKEAELSYLEIIRRGSKQINHIISELLQSAKTVELNPELVDLNILLMEVLSSAQDRMKLKNIVSHVSLLDFPVVKILDKEKFKIAILNLVVNGIEAIDKKQGVINIVLSRTIERTMIQIKDNGSGIEENGLKHLFEPYFTTKKSGMGLGLVSTLNIIKSHKAIIEVESQLGVGTNFKVIFPG